MLFQVVHRLAPLALTCLLLAGCADPAFLTRTSDHEPPPPRDGGPYSGDGTVHAVAAYFSFDIDGDGGVEGDMGGHCAFDDWTLEPPSVLLAVPSDQPVPARAVMREIHPDEDDLDRVGHFGTAPVGHWAGHWNDLSFPAAFDRDRELGAFAWDGAVPHFEGVPIPTDEWLLVDFVYEVDGHEGRHRIDETLHLRDLGHVPAEFDRSDPICM